MEQYNFELETSLDTNRRSGKSSLQMFRLISHFLSLPPNSGNDRKNDVYYFFSDWNNAQWGLDRFEKIIHSTYGNSLPPSFEINKSMRRVSFNGNFLFFVSVASTHYCRGRTIGYPYFDNSVAWIKSFHMNEFMNSIWPAICRHQKINTDSILTQNKLLRDEIETNEEIIADLINELEESDEEIDELLLKVDYFKAKAKKHKFTAKKLKKLLNEDY